MVLDIGSIARPLQAGPPFTRAVRYWRRRAAYTTSSREPGGAADATADQITAFATQINFHLGTWLQATGTLLCVIFFLGLVLRNQPGADGGQARARALQLRLTARRVALAVHGLREAKVRGAGWGGRPIS